MLILNSRKNSKNIKKVICDFFSIND